MPSDAGRPLRGLGFAGLPAGAVRRLGPPERRRAGRFSCPQTPGRWADGPQPSRSFRAASAAGRLTQASSHAFALGKGSKSKPFDQAP